MSLAFKVPPLERPAGPQNHSRADRRWIRLQRNQRQPSNLWEWQQVAGARPRERLSSI